jgi:hypothetical protein
MTFLELCQMTTQQTGTVQGTFPAAVTGQSNRLKQIVDFVREAYVDIQNAHRMWRWLQSEFIGETVIGTSRYAATDFRDEGTGLAIDRFSQWGFKQTSADAGTSMYLTSVGPAEEGWLRWRDWEYFSNINLRGPQTPGKPQTYSIDNQGRMVISPPPDDVYTLRGRYRKSAQYLAADGDIPEMPTDFHTVIKDAALIYVEGFDEGPRIPVTRLRMIPNFSMLENQQLPKVKWGAPLA